MNVQYCSSLFLFIITITGFANTSNIEHIKLEIDSNISFQCEIDQLPFNAIITWVYRPKVHTISEIKWLPLYANGRRLTQNNQRFVVDYSGYNQYTKKHLSILTINQLRLSDEGIYMCKSNQYPSNPVLFNLTVIPSLKILPKDGIIELSDRDRSINLSCTVRESLTNNVDSSRLKWYHNNHEIPNRYIKRSYSHRQNQATLILHIHHLSLNDSGLFKCVYDDDKASKNVQIFYTSSSVVAYSKSTARRRMFSWLLLHTIIFMIQ